MAEADTPSITAAGDELKFHYEKSPSFRVIHVDGAYGGVMPTTGFINMAVFSERTPIPKVTVHGLHEGRIGGELEGRRQGREGVFREIEANLVLSLPAAQSLKDWLDTKIKQAKEMQEQILAEVQKGPSKNV